MICVGGILSLKVLRNTICATWISAQECAPRQANAHLGNRLCLVYLLVQQTQTLQQQLQQQLRGSGVAA